MNPTRSARGLCQLLGGQEYVRQKS